MPRRSSASATDRSAPSFPVAGAEGAYHDRHVQGTLAPRPLVAALAALLHVAGGCGTPTRDTSHDACPPEAPALAPDAGSHALKTVFLIVLENRDWSSFEGNPSAPFINGTLLPRFAHAVDFRNGGLHPSLGNYIALEAGDPLGVDFDVPPAEVSIPVTCHLATFLEQTGLTWKAYAEDIPPDECPIHDVGGYVVRHDPFVYFEDVAGHLWWADRAGHLLGDQARCVAHIRPHDELAADLRSGEVARYVFIIPSLCDSGHDACAPLHDRVRQTDAFLAREVPMLMDSAAFRDGGVILITWDEGSAGDEPIGLIAVSPRAKPGYAGALPYSHASTLRTVQEILGVTPLLRGAATANSLSDLFTAYP